MTKEDRSALVYLLYKYYEEQVEIKKCQYDCTNCDLGMMVGYGYEYSCPISRIITEIENEWS